MPNSEILSMCIDTVISVNHQDFPIRLRESVQIVHVSDMDQMVREIADRQETSRILIAADSERSFKIAQAMNDVPGHYMAIHYNGKWENEQIIADLKRLQNLLVDEHGGEHFIENDIVPNVFLTESGRIAIKGSNNIGWDCIRLSKHQDGSDWGWLLNGDLFCKANLIGVASDISLNIAGSVKLLEDIYKQILSNQNKTEFPRLDTMLVFGGSHCLIPNWTGTADRETAFTKLCFRILFGAEYDKCEDAVELIFKALTAQNVPGMFISDLERIYVSGETCSLEKWGNIFMRFQLDQG